MILRGFFLWKWDEQKSAPGEKKTSTVVFFVGGEGGTCNSLLRRTNRYSPCKKNGWTGRLFLHSGINYQLAGWKMDPDKKRCMDPIDNGDIPANRYVRKVHPRSLTWPPEKWWLEDDPSLLGWYIFRGELLNLQGVPVPFPVGFRPPGVGLAIAVCLTVLKVGAWPETKKRWTKLQPVRDAELLRGGKLTWLSGWKIQHFWYYFTRKTLKTWGIFHCYVSSPESNDLSTMVPCDSCIYSNNSNT